MIWDDRLERALSQAAKKREWKRNLEFEVYETSLDQHDRTTPKQPSKHHDPIARARIEHELTHCPDSACFEICVGAKGLGGHHKGEKLDEERLPVIELDRTFGTSEWRPRTKSGATDSVNTSCFSWMARRKRAGGEYVIQGC